MKMTGKRGVDTAIEAVGIPATFELCEKIVTAGGHIANIGVHGKKVDLHLESLWDRNISITTRLVDTGTIPMLLQDGLISQDRPQAVDHASLQARRHSRCLRNLRQCRRDKGAESHHRGLNRDLNQGPHRNHRPCSRLELRRHRKFPQCHVEKDKQMNIQTAKSAEYQSTNPATGKVLKKFESLTDKELEAKIATAAKCFETWRHKTYAERAVIVAKAAEIAACQGRRIRAHDDARDGQAHQRGPRRGGVQLEHPRLLRQERRTLPGAGEASSRRSAKAIWRAARSAWSSAWSRGIFPTTSLRGSPVRI